MPKLLRFFFWILTFYAHLAFAQIAGQQHSLSLHQDIHDFHVKPLEGKFSSFDSALSQTTRFGYFSNLGKSWGFTAGLNNGYLHNQIREEQIISKAYIVGLDAALQLKMNNGRILKEASRIGPYLIFGYQLDYMHALRQRQLRPFQMRNLYGMGFNIGLGSYSALQFQTSLEQELGGGYQTHLRHRFGYIQGLGKKRKTELPEILEFNSTAWASSSQKISNNLNPELIEQIDSLNALIFLLKDSLSLLRASAPLEESPVVSSEKGTDSTTFPVTADVAKANEQEKSAESPLPAADKHREDQEKANEEEGKTEVEGKVSQESGVGDKNWYVVVLSTKSKSQAQKSVSELSKEYIDVRLLPQPNGLIRVGIYATSNRELAEKVLQAVRQLETPSAWLSYE